MATFVTQLLLGIIVFTFVGLSACFRHKYVTSFAARQLRVRKISLLAVSLITMLMLIYLLVISVLEGFKDNYMDSLQSVRSHITVDVGNTAWGIQEPEAWSADIAKLDPGIKGVTAGLETPAMAVFDKARTVGTLRGIDLDQELKYGRLKEMLWPHDVKDFKVHDQSNKQNLPGCIAGGVWRTMYDLKVGSRITFLFTDESGDPASRQYVVVGFFEGKNPMHEQAAYVDRESLAHQIKVDGRAKTLFVWMKDADRPDLNSVREKIRSRMGALIGRDAPDYKDMIKEIHAETWQEHDGKIYFAMSRENLIMRFIMAVFLALVGLIIFLILGRIVAEKVRDIGALRAMGATPAGIRGCFLAQGLFIGVLGVVSGLIISYFFIDNVNLIANFCGIDPFPTDSFGINKIPTHTLPLDVYAVSAAALFAALAGAFFPAHWASRLNPVECLRHE